MLHKNVNRIKLRRVACPTGVISCRLLACLIFSNLYFNRGRALKTYSRHPYFMNYYREALTVELLLIVRCLCVLQQDQILQLPSLFSSGKKENLENYDYETVPIFKMSTKVNKNSTLFRIFIRFLLLIFGFHYAILVLGSEARLLDL